MYYYFAVLKKYADFTGRARRQEYWMFTLFNAIITIVLDIIDSITEVPVLVGLYTLATIVPIWAVTARRLHDINRSGWWQLLAIIPIVGQIIVFIWLITIGTQGENQYGADPLQEEA